MELRDYLRILRRRWLLVVGCMLAAITVAVGVTLWLTPQYSSESRLFISTPQSNSSEAFQGSQFSMERVTSYADLITGEAVAARVVENLGLNMSADELSEQITSEVIPETVILSVSVTDTNPEQAQELTQAVADTFASYIVALETPPGTDNPAVKATVVDGAGVPESPDSPQPLRNIGLAAILGLLVGIGVAVLRDVLDNTFKTPGDLEAVTEAPLLGAITYDKEAAKKPLITSLGTHSPRTEAFRVLRTNLQFVDVDRNSKVIVVTSSVPLEGKTTTTTNLAITLAQAGQRVALVEGDLRRPRVSEYTSLEPSVGVTTVLVGKLTLDDTLQSWGNDGLSVLTSGAIPPNPSELIQTQAMDDLLVELRRRFDVIIVDAPPLLPVTDAALLASQADGAVLVVRHGKTTRDQVTHSVDRLDNVGARLLGTVLNMTPHPAKSSYGYGYGYGYGDAPGESSGYGRYRMGKTSKASQNGTPASQDSTTSVSTGER